MTITQKIQYVVKLPFERKLWFFLTIITCSLVSIVIQFFNAKYLHPLMGAHLKNDLLCVIATEKQRLKAWRIAKVAEAVCKGLPWENKCLTEAICTNILLKLYCIPSVFYLGSKIEQSSTGEMKAHAWITVGEYCVVGGDAANEGYIVTATFTTPRLS